MKLLSFLVLAFCAVFGIIIYVINDEDGHIYAQNFNKLFFHVSPNADGLEFDYTDYPWRREIRSHFREIKDEFLNFVQYNSLPRYDAVDPVQVGIDSWHQPNIPWEVCNRFQSSYLFRCWNSLVSTIFPGTDTPRG